MLSGQSNGLMNLVYIYGPPAVGKFTVATELSKITNYKLFHNQLSIEFVRSVFDFGSPLFNKLVLKYRAEIIGEAAKSGTSLIFTSSYAKGYNDKIVKDIISRVEKYKGKVCFVQLHCDKKELFRRVESHSRRTFYKINSKEKLEEFLTKYKPTTAIPFVQSLSIDNTKLSPKGTAEKIAKYYQL